MKNHQTTRRVFLGRTGLVIAGGCLAVGRLPKAIAGEEASAIVRLGLLTDVHYADIGTRGNRHYRDSLDKMRTAVSGLNEVGIDAAVVMGDLIDSASDIEGEIGHLRTIEAEYAKIDAPRHYILGNHCVHTLTKEEFIENSGMESPHSSFDIEGIRFVILDSCFNSEGEPYQRNNFDWTDANIPEEQLQWFAEQLASADGPVIVMTHQRIDGLDSPHNVKNGAAVREIMKAAGNVSLVLSGHSHVNTHDEVDGIHYIVVRAMVEGAGADNNSYGRLLVFDDQSIRIEGFVQQDDVEGISIG